MANIERNARIIAIASGKGGVGKTNVTANLAIAMAAENKRVLVFDADLSLANVDVLLGLAPAASIRQVVAQKCKLEDIVVPGPGGISILPASSGVASLADLPREILSELVEALGTMAAGYDVVLVDVPAGIGRNALKFCRMADQLVVMTTPEPTAFTDAYALVKLMHSRKPCPDMNLLVNMAEDTREASRIAEAFSGVTKRFLDTEVPFAGGLHFDPAVPMAVRRQRPFLVGYPSCRVSRQVRELARYLLKPADHEHVDAGQRFTNRIAKWMDTWCADERDTRP